MTIVILTLLLLWIGIGALFRLIGLVIRLIVMIALAAAICALAGAGGAAHAFGPDSYLDEWRIFDGECRGSVDFTSPEAQAACSRRDALSLELPKVGYCWRVGIDEAHSGWRRGSANSEGNCRHLGRQK
jgi:hypothetical protein